LARAHICYTAGGRANNNQTVAIHPGSVLKGKKPQYVLYNELVRTKKHYMRDVCIVEPQWAAEAAPMYFRANAVPAPQ
jgi:HrpA-like RNA helicase